MLFSAVYVFFFILSAQLMMFYLQINRPAEQKQYLVLHPNGQVDCVGGKEYCLHRNSRVGWFGCWLVLIPLKKRENKSTIRYFIFNDSINPQDRSRLTRHLLRAKKYA
jgi:hypothetical protein